MDLDQDVVKQEVDEIETTTSSLQVVEASPLPLMESSSKYVTLCQSSSEPNSPSSSSKSKNLKLRTGKFIIKKKRCGSKIKHELTDVTADGARLVKYLDKSLIQYKAVQEFGISHRIMLFEVVTYLFPSAKRRRFGGSHIPDEATSSALVRAVERQSDLDVKLPSFVKSMVRSHVGSCFWLGLPGPFCKTHLPKNETSVTLEDESGGTYTVKYIADRTGLSAGWRQFCADHKLIEGDALIFQLIGLCRFKVYIIRANDMAEVDGALVLLNLESQTKQNESVTFRCLAFGEERMWFAASVTFPTVYKCLQKYSQSLAVRPFWSSKDVQTGLVLLDYEKHLLGKNIKKQRKSLPLTAVQKKIKKKAPQKLVLRLRNPTEQSDNNSEYVRSEVVEGSNPRPQFKDIISYENFSILVNGLLVDSDLSEDTRTKYYNLCSSQNMFLHEHLGKGYSRKLIAGVISETVNIADSIKTCKLTTPREEFESWRKTLKAFEILGMNVGFLVSRVQRLVILGFESEDALETKSYMEAKNERARTEDEIRKLEEKLMELKRKSERFDTNIDMLKSKAERYEVNFKEEATAQW